MFNTVVFIHVATINQYQQIFEEIFERIIESGLLAEADKVTICVVGNGDLMIPSADHIEVKYDPRSQYDFQGSIVNGEFYSLTQLKEFADTVKENTRILYCHLRGVTSPNNEHIDTWRKYLTHWNIDKFSESLELLKEYDAVGVDLITKDRWPFADHFSGNFWWANSDYIKTLPSIQEISDPNSEQKATLRHNGEFWIGMREGKLKSKHDSEVDICSRHLISCPEEDFQ
jgi:hypothetical protein